MFQLTEVAVTCGVKGLKLLNSIIQFVLMLNMQEISHNRVKKVFLQIYLTL